MADWFTIAEARARPPLQNAVKYPDAAITAGTALVQDAMQDELGVPMTPGTFSVIVPSTGSCDVFLRPKLISVTGATLAGVSVDVASVLIDPDGVATRPGGWPCGRLVIAGTWGYAAPPLRVKNAAIMLLADYLVDSPINDRTTSLTTIDGNTERFVTAGIRDAIFAIPECNAAIERYGMRDALAIG